MPNLRKFGFMKKYPVIVSGRTPSVSILDNDKIAYPEGIEISNV